MLLNIKATFLFVENKFTPFGSTVLDVKVCPTFRNLVRFDNVIVRQVFKRSYCYRVVNRVGLSGGFRPKVDKILGLIRA